MQNATESQGILHFTSSEEKKNPIDLSKRDVKCYFY